MPESVFRVPPKGPTAFHESARTFSRQQTKQKPKNTSGVSSVIFIDPFVQASVLDFPSTALKVFVSRQRISSSTNVGGNCQCWGFDDEKLAKSDCFTRVAVYTLTVFLVPSGYANHFWHRKPNQTRPLIDTLPCVRRLCPRF